MQLSLLLTLRVCVLVLYILIYFYYCYYIQFFLIFYVWCVFVCMSLCAHSTYAHIQQNVLVHCFSCLVLLVGTAFTAVSGVDGTATFSNVNEGKQIS